MTKKQIRKKFKREVFERDNYTCKVCGKQRPEEELNAHHITDRNEMPNGGYVKENGITVCENPCHLLVEEYHMSGHQNYHEGLHPNHLYKMINSSWTIAYTKSSKL